MTITTLSDFPGTVTRATARDIRLDVFRGLGMLIILIAHVPGNPWTLWIPARFGFSDATEMFVFLSGMASAIAFGGTFDQRGPWLLTARVVQRLWQLWWAHLALFLAVFALVTWAGMRPDGQSYVSRLNLQRFAADAGLVLDFMMLRYVPNYFDILPMYMVILALLPVMLMAERAHRALPLALMLGLWALAQSRAMPFPAEPWSDRGWFFDPFGWQLLFFTGFFLRRGTWRAPPAWGWLLALAVMVVVATVPFAWYQTLRAYPVLRDVADAIRPLTSKTTFGLFRYLHFLSLAVIALALVGPAGARLTHPVIAPVTDALRRIGQQSLAVFLAGMFLAQGLGIALDQTGRDTLTVTLANLSGCGVLYGVARITGWFKSSPWSTPRP
ncbi:MAG: OpgC domain-containing protein [Paracoccus sp.]|nr:OpgC domain-containing protein [Paracoccus sp. (in: a-proteobacteria)]